VSKNRGQAPPTDPRAGSTAGGHSWIADHRTRVLSARRHPAAPPRTSPGPAVADL